MEFSLLFVGDLALVITWLSFRTYVLNFMFEFPCIVSQYYIKNQQDATLTVLFISHCEITLHVSDVFCVHHQEY
jgi:hypothetical protein